ncbi:MAG TPA: hypothetical protein VH541_05765 [Gaiellaceae bacterium]
MEDQTTEVRKFNHKERGHLMTLQRRLDYLREEGSRDRSEGALGFIAGEANALAWVLSLLTNHDEMTPEAIRMERIEHAQRTIFSRLGRLEALMETPFDE